MNIRYADRAVRDLEEIKKYLAENAPEYEERVLRGLIAKISTIPRMPKRGVVVPELVVGEKAREIIFSPYRICYLIEQGGIVILAILHQRQAWPISLN